MMDLETALTIVDDDLPDGAYFAMLGELTGLEHDEIAEALIERHERSLADKRKGKTREHEK